MSRPARKTGTGWVDETGPGRERDDTDASLRTERENADAALQKVAITEVAADIVVAVARDQADAVMSAARIEEDRKVDEAHPSARQRDTTLNERRAEDDRIEAARSAADEALRRQREAEATLLARFFPRERNATDRHLLTERARADDAVAGRDDFLGMVSHDLRNLLLGIVLTADTLHRAAAARHDVDEEVEAGMEAIQLYAARMNRLIGDLLDVTSIDAGRLAVVPRQADAGALLEEAVRTFAPMAAEKQIALEFNTSGRPLVAEFDHDRLLQVLANVITNALKFTPAGGRVWLHAGESATALTLSVRDTGRGIPGDRLEAVFNRFWQTTKNEQRGLGLGLYISRCIVEAHGGTMWATSAPGEGAAFHVALPLAQSHPTPAVAARREESPEDVEVPEDPPQNRENDDRADAAAAQLLCAPAGGQTPQ